MTRGIKIILSACNIPHMVNLFGKKQNKMTKTAANKFVFIVFLATMLSSCGLTTSGVALMGGMATPPIVAVTAGDEDPAEVDKEK
uniref:Lipoprotein-attachment site-containing protein n=1 Tax=Candidatus Kentrum sp. FW TaxID=2126338 RepID=A0A450U2D6_9GAMM|nr:MAG: hypothetical protein BECKFW1821C_GA0114237_111611 [Candidatus Kentron sp. FW]